LSIAVPTAVQEWHDVVRQVLHRPLPCVWSDLVRQAAILD
jgi:hypothetical protein